MQFAVVHNTAKFGIISCFGQPCPEEYGAETILMAAGALRDAGHAVTCLEGDKTLLGRLEALMPADSNGDPTGMVFNMAYGIQGSDRYTHVPAMLELAGVPYTGSSPLGHSLALDKVITKILMEQAGVPTPAYGVFHDPDQAPGRLRFPLIVKPRHESTSFGLCLARDGLELRAGVRSVLDRFAQEALVEEYIPGREVNVGLLGQTPAEVLPPVELDFSTRDLKLMTIDDKRHHRWDEPEKLCPAPIDAGMRHRLSELALATFEACRLRDYARVDFRIDPAGQPFALEINSMAALGASGSYMTAALQAGYTPGSLVLRILNVAHFRSFGRPLESPRVSEPVAVSIQDAQVTERSETRLAAL